MSSLIALAISGVSAIIDLIMPPSRELLEERYLNEAEDIHDLEYRIRQIDRGSWVMSRSSVGSGY